MTRAMTLIGAAWLFTGAHAGDELQFPDHGFSIELAEANAAAPPAPASSGAGRPLVSDLQARAEGAPRRRFIRW